MNFGFTMKSNTIKLIISLTLAKRLSEKEKIKLVECFANGKTIEELTVQFAYTKLTIVKHLKNNLGEEKYKEIINQGKQVTKTFSIESERVNSHSNNKEISSNHKKEFPSANQSSEELFPISPFFEITPLNCEIENTLQKDLSSVPISEIDFPKVVYMIVDKKIELEIKYLKEYPEWQFLSQEELSRKTIEIYLDMKIAKRFCNKEQKVIKVPNTDVFKIVAPILIKKGISRIVSADQLISL